MARELAGVTIHPNGSELDLMVSRKFHNIYSVGLKYALYNADTFATDTEKFWLSMGLAL